MKPERDSDDMAVPRPTVGMWDKRPDIIVRNPDPFNAEPPADVLAANNVTATNAFFSRNHGSFPDIPRQDWRLIVGGAVAKPLELDYDQLTNGFTAHSVTATLACAGNRRAELVTLRDMPGKEPWTHGAISTAEWGGARLVDVLAAAQADTDENLYVAFAAPDVAPEARPVQSFGASIPMSKAVSPEVLLAWRMNGEPLPRIHGGPVRVIVPGYIGARSVKWVSSITVQSNPSDNYFQALDYRLLPADADPDSVAPGEGISMSILPVNSDILEPLDGHRVPSGDVMIRGYAISGHAPIARVEVSVDGGEHWRQAHLEPPQTPWAWRFWSLPLEIPPVSLTVAARAWDETGNVQPENPAHLWNPRGYGNNAWPRIDITAV